MLILTKTLLILALLMACEISAFGSPKLGETTVTDIDKKPVYYQPLFRYRRLTLDAKGYLAEKTYQHHYTSPQLVTTRKFLFARRSDRPNAHAQKIELN